MSLAEAGLLDAVGRREPRALARAISLIEARDPDGRRLLAAVHARTGRARVLGITGPPGAGKSCLVDRLTTVWRRGGQTVGVLAIDPTSPASGGALLGDRIRMASHAGDTGVYIRSMASRGRGGGLAEAADPAVRLLDAAGFDVVIVETVGAGQDEVAVAAIADLVVVVVPPEAGDEVQVLKAGLMEIADVFVVNKADLAGADRLAAAIETLAAHDDVHGRVRPVVRSVASQGDGIAALADVLEQTWSRLADEIARRRLSRSHARIRAAAARRLEDDLKRRVADAELAHLAEQVTAGTLDPEAAADLLLRARPQPPLAARLDHVGIAVADAGPLAERLFDLFALQAEAPEDVGDHRVRFLAAGNADLELVEPRSSDAAVATFLERRGTALHHVCLEVGDLAAVAAGLRARGVRFIDDEPRPGAHGTRIMFIHPASVGGLLVELKQTVADPVRTPGDGR